MIYELRPWYFYSQLSDWTADGQPDEDADNNCGPESLAMCLAHLTDLELPADYIKDTMYGEGYTGYTDFEHAQNWLTRYARITSGLLVTPDPAIAFEHIQAYVQRGHPCIALFWFDIGAQTGGHFSPIQAVDTQARTVTRADPWTGAAEVMSFERWSRGYKGGILELHRRRAVVV